MWVLKLYWPTGDQPGHALIGSLLKSWTTNRRHSSSPLSFVPLFRFYYLRHVLLFFLFLWPFGASYSPTCKYGYLGFRFVRYLGRLQWLLTISTIVTYSSSRWHSHGYRPFRGRPQNRWACTRQEQHPQERHTYSTVATDDTSGISPRC